MFLHPSSEVRLLGKEFGKRKFFRDDTAQKLIMNTNKLIMRVANKARHVYRFQNNHSRPVQNPPASAMAAVSQLAKEKETFLDAFPGVVDSLVQNPKISKIPEVSNWVRKLLEYTLTGGKTSRGLATVFAYETVETPENLTVESLRMARTMGWCVELVQSYFLVLDDMMDGSSIRRGKPCWYTLPNVGIGGVNDSLLMHCSIYEILKMNCGTMPLYNDILDLFNEALLYTSMGQHLDYTMAHRIKSDYSLFTIERYNSIVKYKTAYYTFKLPILLGYLLANNSDKDVHKRVEDVCLTLGRLFQIQDDILDCYGNETVISKNGTDIQEGKCSWLAVQALKLSNDEQRAFFIENYADKDPAKVQNIKKLFEDLNLLGLYNEEEKALYNSIQEQTNSLPASHRKLFYKLLNMTYKRQK